MTREEAIAILKTADFPEDYTVEEIQQALDMAIRALKNEQTDGDLISRKEAEKCCLDGWNKDYKDILEDIRKLPSVENTAEWIKSDIPNEKYKCSKCGGACWYYDYQGYISKSRYCPNCGARMKESEVKNEDNN